MKDFPESIIDGQGIIPPGDCLKIFQNNFPDAINADWFKKEDHYEAVFYMEQIEYIALFMLNGKLIEYKMFLPSEYLPLRIRNLLSEKGEIMNAVLINDGRSVTYECIIRDKELNRFLIYLSSLGKIIEERVL